MGDRYRVTVRANADIEFDAFVEADSEEQAKRIAEKAEPGDIEEYPEDPTHVGMLTGIRARSARRVDQTP